MIFILLGPLTYLGLASITAVPRNICGQFSRDKGFTVPGLLASLFEYVIMPLPKRPTNLGVINGIYKWG